jgi:uncharacterized protein (TIGR00661 family)
MKILYGVVGEGMGHAMRSRVVLSHLVAQNHDVEIMASGRATDFLKKHFHGVNRIHGLHMIYDDNRVRLGKTLWSNVSTGATGLPGNIAAYFELIREFKPDLVISDFESWTYLYGQLHRIPILSIDNMQIINRCTHGPDILEGMDAEFQLTRAFIKTKLPWCEEYFITTFFRPEIRKKKTRLFPPILRPEILAAKREDGEHVLVYQTAEGNDGLSETLEKTGVECRIYGMKRGITEEERHGNLRYMPFSEDGFIRDLASSRAVIAGGGFTLMGEAVYLQKPMLAVPLDRQFEQVLNARYLTKLGYGRGADHLRDPKTVHEFLEVVPECRKNLASYTQNGNLELFAAVDEFIDKVAGGVL